MTNTPCNNETETLAHACECEHVRHFEPTDADPGHPYGHPSRDATPYKIDGSGTFWLCAWCWEICHNCEPRP